jgi:hypothetical protein
MALFENKILKIQASELASANKVTFAEALREQEVHLREQAHDGIVQHPVGAGQHRRMGSCQRQRARTSQVFGAPPLAFSCNPCSVRTFRKVMLDMVGRRVLRDLTIVPPQPAPDAFVFARAWIHALMCAPDNSRLRPSPRATGLDARASGTTRVTASETAIGSGIWVTAGRVNPLLLSWSR